MLMLTSYLDETGDSQDEKQKFNGMAGLLGPAENWEEFEWRWKDVVTKRFKLPYIHMSEMGTLLAGWPKPKVDDLSARLWKVIRDCALLPIGSIIPMDDYRPLEAQLRKYFRDPYYIAMQNCVEFASEPLKMGAFPDSRLAMIFDDKVEFRDEAKKLYDAAVKALRLKDRVDEPAFRNMRVVVPLQAADMIAYEVYKEYDRVYYKHSRKVRFGWEQIEKIYKSFKAPGFFIMRHNKYILSDWIKNAEAANRLADYWEKRRAKKRELSKCSDS